MPDYGLGLVQPSMINQQLAQGVNTGIALGDARVAAMDRQLVLERQAQADAAAKAQQEAALASRQAYIDAGEKVIAGGFKSDDVLALRARFPEAAKHYADIVKTMDETTKRNHFRNAASVFSVAKNDPIKGAEYAEKLAEAAKNTPGQEQQVASLTRLADQIRANPGGSLLQTAAFMAEAADNPKEFAETFDRMAAGDATLLEAKAKAGQAQAEQKIKEVQAETERATRLEAILASEAQRKMWANQTGVAWARLKFDRDKMNQDADDALADRIAAANKLSPDAFKHVAEKGIAAVGSNAIADDAEALAAEVEAAGGQSGVSAATTRKFQEAFGSQDPKTNALYARFETLKSKGIYRDIGPGTKTDDDYAAFERGWPGANASPQYKASFLKGMAKAARFAAATENAQADYVSQNGDPGNAKRDIVVSGVVIPAGTTYANAVKMARSGIADDGAITENGLDQ